jgi:hypothetical protein
VSWTFWQKLVDDYWNEFTIMSRLGNGVVNRVCTVQNTATEATAN